MFKVWKFEYEKQSDRNVLRKVVLVQDNLTFSEAKEARSKDRSLQISEMK